MLKDITIGQFFPGNSIIHRLDSRFKIVLDIAYVVMLFMAGNYCSLISAGLFDYLYDVGDQLQADFQEP